MVWSWIPGNLGLIGQLTRQNAYIGIVSAVTGLVIAVPLGIASARWRWLYPPLLSTANVIYALPSLALFVALIAYTGLSDATVIIPLATRPPSTCSRAARPRSCRPCCPASSLSWRPCCSRLLRCRSW